MSSKYHLGFAGVSADQFYFLFLLSVTVSNSHVAAVITRVSPPISKNKFPTSVTLSSVEQETAFYNQTQSADNQTQSVSRQTQSIIDSSSTEVISTESSYNVTSLPTRITKVITIALSSRRPLTTHDAHKAKLTTSASEATNITTPNPATTNQSHFTRENSNVTVPSISITTTNDTGSENGSTPLTYSHQVTTKLTPTGFLTSTAFVLPTTTAPKSPPRPRFARPLTVIQHLDINGKFNPRLNNRDDVLRQNYTKVMQTFLMKHYRTFVKSLQNVTVVSFSKGSINVEYYLVIDPPVGNSSALGVVEGLRKAVQSWTDLQPVALIGTISINKTLEQSLPLLNKLQTKLQKPCMGEYDACSISEVCQFDSKGDYYCKHKCSDFDCGQHGVCAVNMAGKAICSCKGDAEFIYHGPKCRQKRSKHTTEPETGSNTVVIAVGVCVPVIVILGIIIIVMCLRRRKTISNDKADTISTTDLDIENFKIENIPVDGFEHQSQQLRYQPSNIGKPIHRISSGSNQSYVSAGEFTMDQMPSFDNMDPPEQRTISDYMDKN